MFSEALVLFAINKINYYTFVDAKFNLNNILI